MSRVLNLVAVLPGMIQATAADLQEDPEGWLFCDGRAVSRTEYAALFTAIGTKFGVGDGSTTFNIPDLRGRSPVFSGQGNTAEGGGAGTARGLGDSGGAEEHTLSVAQMPQHNHTATVTDPGHTHLGGNTGASSAGIATFSDYSVGAHDVSRSNTMESANTGISVSVNNRGSGSAHNNMPPFVVLNALIKT